jgi:hypothetical protein
LLLIKLENEFYICTPIAHKIFTMNLLRLLALLLLLPFHASLFAQNDDVIEDEVMLKQYLQQNTFDIDTAARAVILYEQGYSTLSSSTLEFHIERTIKFLSDDAISDLATINIPYKDRSFVTRVEGTTYNLVDGKVIEQSLRDEDIIREKLNENITVSKFNLPGIRKGSIIHYSYSIYKPGTLLIPEWSFQNDYPTLYSEYNMTVPSNITYNSIERLDIPMKLANKKKELINCESCSFSENYGGDETHHTWIRRNIPAFKSEPFMSSADNFRERIKINVVSVINNGYKTQLYNNWEDFTKKYFYADNDFGGQVFSNNNFLKEKTEELTKDQPTGLKKAQAIFAYVRNNFITKQTQPGDEPEMNIKDIFNRKTGSPEGINLLLTAMLRKANLESEPVLLSTRDNERLNGLYIDPRNINYIISRLIIDKNQYLLDATNKYNPFNTLPPDCYNGYCRTITKTGGTAIILDPDNIKNRTTIVAKLSPTADSTKLLLKIDKQYGVYTALALRNEWTGDTAEVRKSIGMNLGAETPAANIRNISIQNLNDPDLPLNLHYEILIDFAAGDRTIYFDPYYSTFFDKNPFASTKRTYNIEMDYLQDINYIFNFEIPKGFVIDDYPKSVINHYGEDQLLVMKNIMEYDEASRTFSLNSRFISKTTLFAADDYESLRTFYDRMMQEQNKKLILKKIN